MTYISSLFSPTTSLTSDIITPQPTTDRPSQPVGPGGTPDSGMRNVQVVLKDLSNGDEIVMSGDK